MKGGQEQECPIRFVGSRDGHFIARFIVSRGAKLARMRVKCTQHPEVVKEKLVCNSVYGAADLGAHLSLEGSVAGSCWAQSHLSLGPSPNGRAGVGRGSLRLLGLLVKLPVH